MSHEPAHELTHINGVRTPDIKVLALGMLGMCRCGTQSLAMALQQLWYKPHHMFEVLRNERVAQLWDDFLLRKLSGVEITKTDLDKVLGDFDAITDLPCCVLAPDLLAAYPDAKVIVNIRPVDSWLVSMHKTIFYVWTRKSFLILPYFDDSARLVHGIIFKSFQIFSGGVWDGEPIRQAYLRHAEHIMDVVPREKLLVFEQPWTWEPLCRFLGRERPEGVYPVANDSAAFLRWTSAWRRRTIVNVARRFVPPIAAGTVAGLGMWFSWSNVWRG